ncbi:apolipoprotein C-II-like [Elgaria multicarinata webbii]|uniref:apolipoprotein C-II-like n=1 Tax=Elgaria multicarinata webbii TaxID=159646 RepID=UPI002FCCE11E
MIVRMDLQVLALSVLLLLFCSEVSSYHLQKRDAPTETPTEAPKMFSQVHAAVSGFFDNVSSSYHGFIDSVKSLRVPEKIRDFYEGSVEYVSTYGRIISDQVVHSFNDSP